MMMFLRPLSRKITTRRWHFCIDRSEKTAVREALAAIVYSKVPFYPQARRPQAN